MYNFAQGWHLKKEEQRLKKKLSNFVTKRKEIFKSTYRVNKGFTATINAGKTQTFILAVDTLGILDKHGLLNEYHLRTAGQCKSLLVPRGYTMYFSARTTVLV